MPELPKREQICLFLDVDGTLLDIAPRPHDVVVPGDLIEDLARAAFLLDDAVVLISGRKIEELDRLFRPLGLRAVGVHGAEIRFARKGPIVSDPILPAALRQRLKDLAARFPGALAEDKGASVALHFRACPESGVEMMRRIEAELARENDPSLVVLPGHFVIEVKRHGCDKGTALEAFMRLPSLSARKPVMIGDDVTDEAAFRAAIQLGGYALSVGRDVPGTERLFENARDVRDWLKNLVGTDDVKRRGGAAL